MDSELKKIYEISDTPEERFDGTTGNLLEDRITGILIGFAQKVKERDGWVDIITTRRARVEIYNLLKDYKKGKI